MNNRSFILDCSVAITWCFEDEKNEHSKFVLNYCMKHGSTVPYLWKLEITNTLLVSEKRNRLHIADTVKFIDLYNSLPLNISNFNFSINEITQSARANNLTSYYATYLLTAMHEGLPIATNDKALIKACHNNGVPLLKENLS